MEHTGERKEQSPNSMIRLPISKKYDSPIVDAVAVQIVLGVLALLILDGGRIAQVCGIALVAFWVAAFLMIWRRPQTPNRLDLELIRFGYFPILFVSFYLTFWIWRLRGVI